MRRILVVDERVCRHLSKIQIKVFGADGPIAIEGPLRSAADGPSNHSASVIVRALGQGYGGRQGIVHTKLSYSQAAGSVEQDIWSNRQSEAAPCRKQPIGIERRSDRDEIACEDRICCRNTSR